MHVEFISGGFILYHKATTSIKIGIDAALGTTTSGKQLYMLEMFE